GRCASLAAGADARGTAATGHGLVAVLPAAPDAVSRSPACTAGGAGSAAKHRVEQRAVQPARAESAAAPATGRHPAGRAACGWSGATERPATDRQLERAGRRVAAACPAT